MKPTFRPTGKKQRGFLSTAKSILKNRRRKGRKKLT